MIFFLFMKINFSYLIFDVSNFSVSNWCFCLPIWYGSGAHNPYHHRKIFGSLSINWLIDFISINIINLWIFFSYDFPTKKICKRKKVETIFFSRLNSSLFISPGRKSFFFVLFFLACFQHFVVAFSKIKNIIDHIIVVARIIISYNIFSSSS